MALAIGCLSTQAVALEPPPPSPPPPTRSDISLELARQGVETALAVCNGRGEKVIAEVVDWAGNTKVLMTSDGALPYYKAAQSLAYTALKTRISSGDFTKKSGPDLPARLAADPKLGFGPGGIPILKGDLVLGAISVVGSKDDACARAGRDKIEAGLKIQKSN
jgi:uncharacterized protein GlcG (DUF336 family)